MIMVDERERKYLIKNVQKNGKWEKEHIVYQWFIDATNDQHFKKKIIFDLTRARVVYASVSKKKSSDGVKKAIEYLDINTFNPSDMVGLPFVLKRRSINDKLFLDRFIRSNNFTEYLLEDEADTVDGIVTSEFEIVREVTDNQDYYNQNMTTLFSEEDAKLLSFLLAVF